MATSTRFDLGKLVASPGALAAFTRCAVSPLTYISRHARGDWGELDADDMAENDLSVTEGFRILSAYSLPDGTRIWVITEADRSVTTCLLPEEY